MRDPQVILLDIRHLIEELDDARLDTMPPHDRIELYASAVDVPAELAVLMRSLRTDAIAAMHDLDVPPKILYDTAGGGVVLGKRNTATYRWRGWELCDALAEDRIEIGTGEIVRAVDVDRLRAVLPACADDSATSSKWNATGVRRFVELDRYREGEPVYEDTIDVIPKMARDD